MCQSSWIPSCIENKDIINQKNKNCLRLRNILPLEISLAFPADNSKVCLDKNEKKTYLFTQNFLNLQARISEKYKEETYLFSNTPAVKELLLYKEMNLSLNICH